MDSNKVADVVCYFSDTTAPLIRYVMTFYAFGKLETQSLGLDRNQRLFLVMD